jgi:hypothetical protein
VGVIPIVKRVSKWFICVEASRRQTSLVAEGDKDSGSLAVDFDLELRWNDS